MSILLMQRSFEAIESLPFSGHKLDPLQPNAFPRCPQVEVPTAIKNAQVENAVSLSDSSTSEDAAFYEKLWQFGVESYSIGNLSEKTSSGAWGRGSTTAHGIVSARASNLLQPYLHGGYEIRGGHHLNKYGEVMYQKPVSLKCRREATTKDVQTANGSLAVQTTAYYVDDAQQIRVDDRVDGRVILTVNEYVNAQGYVEGYEFYA